MPARRLPVRATIAAAEEGEGQILDLYSGAQSDSGAGEISQHEILTLESKTMTPDKGTWSWDVIPEDIPADQIAETVDTGVLVIGAGLAGCCAAIAAAEEGAQVTLIEKTETDTVCGRGLDIAAFHTRKQQELVEAGPHGGAGLIARPSVAGSSGLRAASRRTCSGSGRARAARASTGSRPSSSPRACPPTCGMATTRARTTPSIP